MTSKSKNIALQATFQTFVSCYVREIPSNQEWKKENIDGVEMDCLHLYLTHNQTHYCIELRYQSIVGPHQYGRTFSKKDTESLVEIDQQTVLIAIMQELHFISNDQSITELIGRVFESMSNMTKMIEKKLASSANQDLLTYLSQEKSLHYGHWLHPTPKSRQGMSDWLLHQYSPELHGAFQLHYFSVKRTMIEEYSTLSKSAGQFIIEELKNSRKDVPSVDLEKYLIVPMHPLQAQNLLHQAYVQKAIERNDILDLGRLGDEYHATSSIRTVYSPSRHWMYKFSLPVKITNSLRVNKLHELRAGVMVSDLIHSLPLHSTYSSFEIIHDPAYIRVKFNEVENESGWEVILRENIFRGEEGEGG
ncbi:IucA/IucC family protein [Bacillus coahuilensis]|uniref:IucA/IucC family protein n=1 Tax=Bacillus coahuilensis TaxID=408580 RepID=UPI0002E0E1CE|nr:IucA/IucC family protein [Bacillus coahuilensis]